MDLGFYPRGEADGVYAAFQSRSGPKQNFLNAIGLPSLKEIAAANLIRPQREEPAKFGDLEFKAMDKETKLTGSYCRRWPE